MSRPLTNPVQEPEIQIQQSAGYRHALLGGYGYSLENFGDDVFCGPSSKPGL